MIHIMVKHRVEDYAVWKTAFDNFVDFRRSSGEKTFRILHPNGDPNDLTLLFGWDSEENAKRFFACDELKSTMQKAGVAESPAVQFLNQVAEGRL